MLETIREPDPVFAGLFLEAHRSQCAGQSGIYRHLESGDAPI
jgi:hypothetical protein